MTRLSREDLHDLVWSEPVSVLAKRFGVSDVWLKKCCQRAGIPVPNRGYWAKLRAGKPATRGDLPPRPPATPTEVLIGEDRPAYRWRVDPEAELAAPPPVEPTFPEPIDSVAERVARSLGKIRFRRSLGSTHQLIRTALDEDQIRRLKPQDAPSRLRYTEPYFETAFERRRLEILSNLFGALEAAGHQPWLGEQARDLGVRVGRQRISFALDHPNAKKDAAGRIRTPKEAGATLRLDIPATGDTWTDDAAGLIENKLTEIVVKLIVAGEVQFRAHARDAYAHACKWRLEMERDLAKKRAEAEQRARKEAIKAEKEQREALLLMARDHRSAEDIRAFINAAVRRKDHAETRVAVENWATWAFGIADGLDPIGKLQLSGDGLIVSEEAAASHDTD